MLECLALIIYETNLVVCKISDVHFFFLQQKKRNQSRYKTMYDKWVRVSPQAWRNSIPLTLPSNVLVQTHFGGLVIPLPMLVFLPVGSSHTLWTSALGFLALEKRLSRSNIKEWNFLSHNFLCLEAAEKYVEPFSCLGSGAGWNSKLDNQDEKVHIAGPALAQLFQPKKQLYRISVCKGEEVFSICFLICIFFFKGR